MNDLLRVAVSGEGIDYGLWCDRLLYDGHRVHFASLLGPPALVRGAMSTLSQGLAALRVGEDSYSGVSPARHLLARIEPRIAHGIFASCAITAAEGGAILILDPTPERLMARLRREFALCVIPEWAEWLYGSLPATLSEWEFARLAGHGITGWQLRVGEDRIQEIVSDAVRKRELRF